MAEEIKHQARHSGDTRRQVIGAYRPYKARCGIVSEIMMTAALKLFGDIDLFDS